MPVITLPRDDRWGSLGAGVGSFLGPLIQQVQQQKIAQGVAKVWNDPDTPDDQKLIRSMLLYGDQGGQIGLQLLRAKTLAATVHRISQVKAAATGRP